MATRKTPSKSPKKTASKTSSKTTSKVKAATAPFSKKLEKILTEVCKGIEAPALNETSDGHEKERLIERLEMQSYPHATIECPHQEELQIGEDCVDCQLVQYETYKARFSSLAEEKGYAHTHTLKAAFDLNSSLITQYRLTELDELLDKIYDDCIARGSWSAYYIMAIQARAFLRFKQGHYQESIDYFKLQLDAIGPNEHIYENMALAYGRLHENTEASACYARAILMIQQKPQEQQKFSTLLLGLSAVIDKPEDALTVLDAGMDLLKQQYDKPHSLMAKTLTAMGDLHLKLDDLAAAEKCYGEAVTIFIDTCGYETPLTSNAMSKHAEILLLLGKKDEAITVFINALEVWANVDDHSFEPNMVVKAILALKNEPEQNHNIKVSATSTLTRLQNKIKNSPMLSQDLNVLCLLKFLYELFIVYGNIPKAMECCQLFIECLAKVDDKGLGEMLAIKNQLQQEATEILTIMQTIKSDETKH